MVLLLGGVCIGVTAAFAERRIGQGWAIVGMVVACLALGYVMRPTAHA